MESPPPYYSSAPKKSNTGLIIGIVIGVVVLCCILPIAVLGGLGFYGFSKAKGMVGCSITFGNVQHAITDYATAHDGKLPNAATWETDIKPYYQTQVAKHAKEQQMFAPGASNGALGCSNDDSTITGISFNKALSGKKLGEIKDPFDSVLIFEVPIAGTNLNSEYKPQPYETSPQMFNKRRGWYVAKVSGAPKLLTKNGESVDVSVNTTNSENN